MSRLFNGSSDHLSSASTPITAAPLTLAAWFNSDLADWHDQGLVWVGDASVTDQYFVLNVRSHEINIVNATTRQGTEYTAGTSTSWVEGTLHHACAVFASSSSRAVYLDGGGKGTEGSSATPSGVDTIDIGRYGDSSPSGTYFTEMVAEAAMWSAALTDEEVEILAAGYSPLLVRPQSLESYWSLIRGLTDRVGGYDLTATGTTVSVQPPIIYPSSSLLISPVEAEVPLSIQITPEASYIQVV